MNGSKGKLSVGAWVLLSLAMIVGNHDTEWVDARSSPWLAACVDPLRYCAFAIHEARCFQRIGESIACAAARDKFPVSTAQRWAERRSAKEKSPQHLLRAF